MKKGLLAGAFLLATGLVSAQGLYVGVGGGYGFATPGDQIGSVDVIDANGNRTTTATYGTLGGGVNTGLNVGYMFTEHFGAELGVNYFIGSEVTTTDLTTPAGVTTAKSKSSQLRLAPALVLTTGGDLALYGKAGLVLPAGGSTVTQVVDNNSFPGVTFEQEYESTGAFSLGFMGAIGVDYTLSDKLSIFGELNGVNLRIKSNTRSTTKSSANGTDNLGDMDTYDKEIVYVDELNSNSNNAGYNPNYSTSSAQEQLASTTNFNGLFINIGVKIRL